jgi:hypothetical protein
MCGFAIMLFSLDWLARARWCRVNACANSLTFMPGGTAAVVANGARGRGVWQWPQYGHLNLATMIDTVILQYQ